MATGWVKPQSGATTTPWSTAGTGTARWGAPAPAPETSLYTGMFGGLETALANLGATPAGQRAQAPAWAPDYSGYTKNGAANPFNSPQSRASYSPTTPAPTYQQASHPAFNPSFSDNVGGSGANGGAGQPGQGLFDKPGYGEQWYEKNKDAWSQPSQSEGYWAGVSGAFQGGPVAPTNTQNQFAYSQGQLGHPGAGYNNAQAASGQLSSSNPWAGQSYIQSTLPYYGQQGAGEQYAQWAAPQTQQTGYGESLAQGTAGQLQAQGSGEGNAYRSLGYFNAPGQMEQAYPGIVNELNGIQYGREAIGTAGDAANRSQLTQAIAPGMLQFAGQNPIGDEYSRYFADGLRNTSNSENLYNSGQGERALTTYYDRAQSKQSKAIDNAMAARGLFGSGAAMRGQEELAADIGAAQARDMASLAGQADQARLGRGGQALQFSSAADASQQARRRLGLDSAVASDSGNRANANMLLDAFGMASGEALNRTGQKANAAASAQGLGIQRTSAGVNAGLAADAQGVNRLNTSAQLGLAGQRLGLDRIKTGADIASQGQTLGLSRTNAGVQAASTLDRNLADRLFQGGSLGLSADAENRQRVGELFNQGNTLDQATATAQRDYIQKLVSGAGIASTADTQRNARLNNGFSAASGAQGLFEGRNMTSFNATNGLSNSLSTLVGGQGDKGIADYIDGETAYINGLVKSGQMSAEEGQQKIDQLGQLFKGVIGMVKK